MIRNIIYDSFLSKCDNGLLILDDEFYITEANSAVSVFSGYDKTYIEGSCIDTLFDEITAEKISKIFCTYGCTEISHKITGELCKSNGENITIAIDICGMPDNEETMRWLILKNISTALDMEERLHRSELLLSTTMESLPFDFWINDLDNRTWMQNSCSRSLWGDTSGMLPGEAGQDEQTSAFWTQETQKALDGTVVTTEQNYTVNDVARVFKTIIAPIQEDNKILGIVGMNIDITELKDALEKYAMLLKEVHHRVKNNLQMIMSIISLEAADLSPEDPARDIFSSIVNRIEAVTMIHEMLYSVDADYKIDIPAYVKELVSHIICTADREPIDVQFELDAMEAETDSMITTGLIINELVTNALKYAYTDSQHLTLTVSVKRTDTPRQAVVRVADNGKGFPPDFDPSMNASLGFRLINAMIQQLSSTLIYSSGPEGSEFSFTFPVQAED